MDERTVTAYSAHILDTDEPGDRLILERLRADPAVEIVDRLDAQLANLRGLRPAPDSTLLGEGTRWAYYPWRRAVVAVLGPHGFRALRLDRNRNNITIEEQTKLGSLTIGVAGLSVGHVIAHTLAMQGLCGRLRLADFDHLELSNLNRVPATVFDLGLNKAQVAARRIAELDPYLAVDVFDAGITADTIDAFLDGLDIVIEECDSLDMKVALRMAARARRVPVLMATSDRGRVDVERFDHNPDRPVMHGLLDQLDVEQVAGMSNREKLPHMLRYDEAEHISPRTAASLLEIDRSLSTWPQLASDVIVGAAAMAEAVRRIGLGEDLRSGRCRIDTGWALDQLGEVETPQHHPARDNEPGSDPAGPAVDDTIVAAAMRAPSGGNSQPWCIDAQPARLTISVAPEHTSAMDMGFRGSAVAVGAALYNVRIAAAARQMLGPVSVSEDVDGSPVRATMQFGNGSDPALADLYEPMVVRETNRHRGTPQPLDDHTKKMLAVTAEREGARLHLVTERDDLSRAATIFGAADRIRYLTRQLHTEMVSELRWPGDPDPDTGIDVRSLELDASDLALMDIVRRPDVMAYLADWNAGSALGDGMRDEVLGSSALAVLTVTGGRLSDYVRGGSAVEAVWIVAQREGLAVRPLSPVFLHARNAAELHELSAGFADELARLQDDFVRLTSTAPDESIVLALRLTAAPPASVSSRRSLSRVRFQGL
ncbi:MULTISPECIES: Rv1355c family protein [Mycobacterium]|uniref:Rv1355c family protein n=1 Tax=Mycobacterium colombiense TaxID=339268 RepID=A0A329LK40_9MYCO|nr:MULTISPECIES: Rv1355c family protein [Mycobacterium]MDM4142024.1 Rv1355c family protein [Mycobacterium sp. FLAC0960]RAV07033.1 Rv1355c family protein [Mycobacterium colombiense]